jgi:sulfate permease, SulP family
VENVRSHLSEDSETPDIPKGVEVFQIKGPFFFGIANKFEEAEKEINEIPRVRIIRMRRVPFIDSTGIRNLRSFVNRPKKHRTHTVLSGVTEKTLEALKREGFYDELGPENFCMTIECALIRARKLIEKPSAGRQ